MLISKVNAVAFGRWGSSHDVSLNDIIETEYHSNYYVGCTSNPSFVYQGATSLTRESEQNILRKYGADVLEDVRKGVQAGLSQKSLNNLLRK